MNEDELASLPVVVVGSGPCGLAVAAALEKEGISAIVFDRGCVASSIASYPLYMTFFSTGSYCRTSRSKCVTTAR